jgi:hypothetical protein
MALPCQESDAEGQRGEVGFGEAAVRTFHGLDAGDEFDGVCVCICMCVCMFMYVCVYMLGIDILSCS